MTMGDVTTMATLNGRRRTELAAFLRGRRARVRPTDVGIPEGLRRRTPGLRREEVAQLSGVGITWYTWLEQGRPINASVQVLDAIARTLRLDETEREHLYQLAEVPYTPRRVADADAVGPAVQAVVDALDPNPAVVYNARYDVLATNASYRALFPLVYLTADWKANALWQLFTRPECCSPFVDRDEELPLLVATLRGAYGRHVGEPAWEEFLRLLTTASEEFRRLWEAGDVVPPGRRTKVMRHASVGELRLVSTSLALAETPETRVVVYTPDDAETARLLAALAALEDPLVGCPEHGMRLSEIRSRLAEKEPRPVR